MKWELRHWPVWLSALLFAAPLHTLEPAPREYRLRSYHTRTNERIDIVYRRGDSYIPEILAEIDQHLRDSVTGKVRDFDPRLLDLLNASLTMPAARST